MVNCGQTPITELLVFIILGVNIKLDPIGGERGSQLALETGVVSVYGGGYRLSSGDLSATYDKKIN